MVNGKGVLAIIPARGGSKSILGKNIRIFAGYPLLAWSIAAAKQSKLVERIIVSTDDKKIASIARKFGAEAPFLRPAKISQDDSPDLPFFVHALKWLDKHEGYKPELIVQLRPTSPIRPRGLVDQAVEFMFKHPEADSVRGVVPSGQNPHKMWRVKDEHSPMKNLLDMEGFDEPYNAPRQSLPTVYWQTGHIDVIRTSTILNGSVSGKNIYPLLIDPRFTIDIDNPNDLVCYEHLVAAGGLDMVWVGHARRPMPKLVKLIVTDFDGVLTDNRVWVDKNGVEKVAASRSDSIRIRDLKERGIEVIILSSEPNPIVQIRAEKMGIESIYGVDIRKKGDILKKLLHEKKVKPANVVYIGNDLNDLPCFEIAGWAVAVQDAYPEVLQKADYVLARCGGQGALRELCELVLSSHGKSRIV